MVEGKGILDVDRVASIVPISPLIEALPLHVPPGDALDITATAVEQGSVDDDCLRRVSEVLSAVDMKHVRIKPECVIRAGLQTHWRCQACRAWPITG